MFIHHVILRESEKERWYCGFEGTITNLLQSGYSLDHLLVDNNNKLIAFFTKKEMKHEG